MTETYDPKFRLWHWRLGAEQLVFSQQLIAPDTHQPLARAIVDFLEGR